MSRWGVRLTYVGLLLALPALVGCPSSGPDFTVSPVAFSFGTTATSDVFYVSSRGSGSTAWHVENIPAWANVAPENGVTGPGGQMVTVTVDRTDLAPGSYSGTFDVVAGDGNMTVSLSMQVSTPPSPPALAIDSTSVDFGLAANSTSLVVTNSGGGTVHWEAAEDLAWLEVSPDSGSAVSDSDGNVVTLVATRSGLAAGTHTGTLHFTSDGGDIDVPVSLRVPSQDPVLTLGAEALEFGASTPSLPLSITNSGSGDLTWNLAESIPWLTLSATSGTLPPATTSVTATVDRSLLTEGDHSGVITVTSNGGNATVDVHIVVAPPQLNVTPLTLQFGSYATTKILAVENLGSGSLDWTIDATGFPAWLQLSQTSGTVAGTATPVLVTCNRTGMTSGNYNHTFKVVSNKTEFSVTASMTVAPQPVLTVDSGHLNDADEPLAPFGPEGTEMDIFIRNTGSGTLDWSFDASGLPEWLTISPLTGTLTGTQINVVHVTVERGELDTGGYFYRVPLNSNAQDTFLEVSMQVPLRPDIGVDPSEVKLGLDSDIGISFVANTGDPNTILNFKVETDNTWLYFSPKTGTSIGTSGPVKDWKRINIAVDRSQLETDGGTGAITVTAVDGAGEPLPDVEKQTIKVSVEAPSLSFEAAKARLRQPSLVRYSFIMRDARAGAIHTPADFLQEQKAFKIFEDGVEIESTETNSFVTDWRGLKVNLVLMLDFSGSMLNAASQAGLGGPEPLLQLYRDNCATFIRSLPSSWKVSLREFHERSGGPASDLIHGFTFDREALIQTLNSYQVTTYGATELLPAIEEASLALMAEDKIPDEEKYDDADIRFVVVITDGRRTTPPGDIDDASDKMYKNYTRVYSVGWGQDVDHEPLARLASQTGGHYYSTRPDDNGHARPSELTRALQLFSDDLRAFRMLGYSSLSEAEQIEGRITGFFNPPDDSPDRGLIQGTFSQQLEPGKFIGDLTERQTMWWTDGIDAEGNATAHCRALYVPRNVTRFDFYFGDLSAEEPYTVSLVPASDNGLLEGWTLLDLGGGMFTAESPTGAPVPFGAFGELVQVDFTGRQDKFGVGPLEVLLGFPSRFPYIYD